MEKSSLYDLDSIELFESIEHLKLELQRNNLEYKEIFDNIENIKDQYPVVRGILEDEKIDDISLEESKALLRAINWYRDLLRIEQYHIFFLGGKETYFYFKKLGII